MTSISNLLTHIGTTATHKHITSTTYDEDYDEATYTYSSSTTHVLLQPLSAEDKVQLTGGRIDKAQAKAYLPAGTAVSDGDQLVVGSDTWAVLSVETRNEYVKAILTKR